MTTEVINGMIRDMDPIVRGATDADDARLSAIDVATWSTRVTPAPCRPVGSPFFEQGREVANVLVAELDGEITGYVLVGREVPLPCTEHVLDLKGLAIDPRFQRRGLGRLLVDAALAQAADRGATRVKSRVLGTNSGSLALHEVSGFTVEGVLRGEFLLDGVPVDDVLLARSIP